MTSGLNQVFFFSSNKDMMTFLMNYINNAPSIFWEIIIGSDNQIYINNKTTKTNGYEMPKLIIN